MLRSLCFAATGLFAFMAIGSAATLVFDTNPLTGSPVLSQPGRQVVVGEPSLTFNVGTDNIFINPEAFGISGISFANGLSTSLPTSGVNFIVLQNGAPLNAGTAANAIAAQITQPGPGFFIYFNTGLDLPRLVFSTDLDDPNADLAVLARFTNLTGTAGFSALSDVTGADVTTAPEPSSVILTAVGALGLSVRVWRQRASKTAA